MWDGRTPLPNYRSRADDRSKNSNFGGDIPGLNEYYACEDVRCVLESEEQARERQARALSQTEKE